MRGDEKVIFALDKVKFVCYLVVPPHLATAWGCEKSTTSFTMVSIRLNRQGTKNRPYYKIVVVDSHKRRDGAYIEQLGTYDPLVEGVNYKIDLEKVDKWIKTGAKPSETVASIIKKVRAAQAA